MDITSNMQHEVNRLIFPRAIYHKALQAIDEIDGQEISNIIVNGYAGYGKSQFIEAIAEKCDVEKYIVIKGKFEQFTSTPYMAINQVLAELRFVYDDKHVKDSLLYLIKNTSKKTIYAVYLLCEDLFKYHQIKIEPQANVANKEDFYSAINLLVKRLAQDKRRLFIVFDDMQWCDKESCNLILRLVKNRPAYVHFVFAYRSNELSLNEQASYILSVCNDDKSYVESINGFSDEECSSYVKNYIGLDVEKKFLIDINRRAQGNPFFIKQILTSMELEKKNIINSGNYNNSGEYKSLEYYVTNNINNMSDDVHTVIKYLTCFAKPVNIELLSEICGVSQNDIEYSVRENNGFEYILESKIGLSLSHDKIGQVVYDGISSEELNLIHKNISNSLVKGVHDYSVFDTVSHLNLSKSVIDNDDAIRAASLNVEAADRALTLQAYESANSYFLHALDYCSLSGDGLDPVLKDEIKFGYIYTSYLIGSSSNLLNDLDLLLADSSNISYASKYYSVYKDIVVNSSSDYSVAKNKGVTLLSKFKININHEKSNLEQLRRNVDDSNVVDICVNKLKACGSNDFVNSDSKYQMRMLLDLWEASYFSQDLDLMELSIYKIVELSIDNPLCAEAAFGFVMYAMYMSKNRDYDLSYKSGVLALQIIDKFNDETMFPKITNLFCNYSAFYSESFSRISERYYSSYQKSVSTSDYLFGAWAVYFNIWTMFISGKPIKFIVDRCIELYPFLEKTNDKKMIMSFFILSDMFHDLTCSEGVILSDYRKGRYVDVDKAIEYFGDISFPQGGAWQSIISSTRHYIFGDYKKVINGIDLYLTNVSIDIVMFPLTQIYFIESLSLVHIIQECDDTIIQDRLSDSVNSLAALAKASPINFKVQYDIVKVAIVLFKLDVDVDVDVELLISYVENNGNYLEKGILYELLVQYAIAENQPSLIEGYVCKSIEAFEAWGAVLKVMHLKYMYTPYRGAGSLDKSRLLIKPVNEFIDINSLFDITTSLSNLKGTEFVADVAVKHIFKQSNADRVCFIASDQGSLKIMCSKGGGHDNASETLRGDLQSNFICDGVVNFCHQSRVNVFLDTSDSNGLFSADSYIINNSIKSIMCLPIVRNESVLGIIYLENSQNNSIFSHQLYNYLKLLMRQVAVSLANSNMFLVVSQDLNKGNISRSDLLSKVDRINLSHKYANIGVWEWSVETGALDWSDEIFKIFGYSLRDTKVCYENFMKVIHPDDRQSVAIAIQNCLNGAEYFVEHRIIRPDGGIRWLSEKGNVIRDSDKNPIKMFGIVQDITSRKEVDDANKALSLQLNQTHKMESIGQLAGGIAHDFNNILASILGYTELAQRRLSSNDDLKAKTYLNNVYTAGLRAKELVEQMMLFSRSRTSQDQAISLSPIIKESIKLLSSTIPSGIKIKYLISEFVPDILMDPIQAQQILINLCVNSRDAIGDIGNIKITLKSSKQSRLCNSCHCNVTGEYVELTVEDDGSGIENSVMDKIFDPFFTTKDVGEGTGMGMSVVHGIVHSHNGHIVIKSSPQGTSVSILFPPTSDSKEVNKAKNIGLENNRLIQGNIVVVDDEELILEFVKELLGIHGANVTTFGKSTDALEYVLSHPNEVDLLLTDMTMPDMNGVDLSKNILSVLPELPIVLSTGYSLDIDKEISRDIGIAEFLNKPVNSDELIELVSRLLA
ncbi:MAG: PAS domain-containing protein [Gammaproteobacteria bacterium]|nr:PAS domain-containing protein [Gammaproteobacteria bacterium]